MLCFIGLHDWYYLRLEKNGITISYRHCRKCGRWEEFGGNYGDTYWDPVKDPTR